MKRKTILALLVCCAVWAFGLWPLQAAEPAKVLVFAAASTTNAVTDICALFNSRGTARAVASFASSSTLAKQIERGAPADVFISANVQWMDYLVEKKLIDPASRMDMLKNRIVLIAPVSSSITAVNMAPPFDLPGLLAGGKLAMGDPDHVPAGIYGKKALMSLGVWPQVEPMVARARDVRAALAWVERGECPLGVVYATDAGISSGVKVVGRFPESTHPPIQYPIALVAGRTTPAVQAFYDLLRSKEAKAIFEKYGFGLTAP